MIALEIECVRVIACSSRKPVGVGAISQVRITEGRQFWVAAAEREGAGRFVVRADEILTAFLELQREVHKFAVDLIS